MSLGHHLLSLIRGRAATAEWCRAERTALMRGPKDAMPPQNGLLSLTGIETVAGASDHSQLRPVYLILRGRTPNDPAAMSPEFAACEQSARKAPRRTPYSVQSQLCCQ